MRCTVDGCENEANGARGWCRKHYTRWKRHGDPTVSLLGEFGQVCSVDGCGKLGNGGGGLCWAHRDMEKRNGDPTARQRAVAGTGYTTDKGYRQIRAPGHPVSDATGKAYEHRVVLFDKIGLGTFTCVHCGAQRVSTFWANPTPIAFAANDRLQIDVVGTNNTTGSRTLHFVYQGSDRPSHFAITHIVP